MDTQQTGGLKEFPCQNSASVLVQILALEELNSAGLREKYSVLFGKEAPSRSRRQLVARLAYRIQELAYGGLSPEARAKLEAIYADYGAPGKAGEALRKERRGAPVIGTKLMREYQGEWHEVLVLEKGFQYRNGVYRSLSAIAREISGTHTSGPLFFGLKQSEGGE